MEMLFYGMIAALVALVFAFLLKWGIDRKPAGNEKMREIAKNISDGAMVFLMREYKYLFVYVVVVAIVLYLINFAVPLNAILTAVSFILGAVVSALAGLIGMKTATKANVRTAEAARKGITEALKVAFSSGAVMGLSVVGLGLFGISLLSYVFIYSFGFADPTSLIFGFSFGASSIALFARVGGGIYTKAADVGADLVGKVEAGIPEDDPRNPAVIADNVGDNVGDVAGMGADLFESYVGSIIAAMALGFIALGAIGLNIPILIAGVGIISSLIGIAFVNLGKGENARVAMRNGTILAAALMVIGAYFLVVDFLGASLGIFLAVLVGVVSGILIGYLTEYFTSYDYYPTKQVAKASETGSATNILAGISLGNQSTALPIFVIAVAIFLAYHFGGLFGIALAGVGMLSTLGITLAVDAYGPVADNAGGITEMSKLGKEVRERTDALDSVGNTTAAMGKGFAIGSAALTALALFATYTVIAGIEIVNLIEPKVIAGLLLGAMLPFLFSSFAIQAVGKAAGEMIEEVRRQWKEIPGLMQGKAEADYKRCVDISTNAAIKRMIAPALLAILSPIALGLVLGPEAVAGLLAGALVSGVALAIMMANSGGAWDNAKKYIEKGFLGGKGSPAHKAAVVGDTVGDPMKDTSGPSINILIKLMSIVAVIFAALF